MDMKSRLARELDLSEGKWHKIVSFTLSAHMAPVAQQSRDGRR